MTERTLVLLKPDAVGRGLTGVLLDRYLRKGLRLVALEMRMADDALADAHYAEHVGHEYYPAMRAFFTSGPLVAAVVEGEQAVDVVRGLHGATDPSQAAPGTVRGDYGESVRRNCVHASDSAESAGREIALWFPGLA